MALAHIPCTIAHGLIEDMAYYLSKTTRRTDLAFDHAYSHLRHVVPTFACLLPKTPATAANVKYSGSMMINVSFGGM